MDILVNVVNQKLKIATNLKYLISGTQEFIRFVFNLPSDWIGLFTFAQFCQDGVAYNQYLDEDNSVYLPSEIGSGVCTLMLYGSNDRIIGTTNYITLTIDDNILVSDAKSTELSQSLYDKLVSELTVTHEWDGTVLRITSGAGTSEADLKGDKGEKGDAFTYDDFTETQLKSLKGEQGAPGADGYTPVKGTDYYTTAEKEALIAEIKTALYKETWVFELEDGSTVTKVVHIG